MKVYIASDHAGVDLKSQIVSEFNQIQTSAQIVDLGPTNHDSVDYPDFADLICKKLREDSETSGENFGILICGSGQGMVMRANRYPHIRAALCWTNDVAKLAREHNNANVLCLPGRLIDPTLALSIVKMFLGTQFSGGRHSARVAKLSRPVS